MQLIHNGHNYIFDIFKREILTQASFIHHERDLQNILKKITFCDRWELD